MNPRDVGLHHDEWRPHQRETLEWLLSSSQTTVFEAPTGSGKTSLARALTHHKRGIALVRTKALQEENYEREYGFVALYGKGNYACVHPDARPGAMADECLFAETGMYRCGHAAQCPYLQQKALALRSPRTALNYAYWLNVYDAWEPFEILVCDEAHQLSEIVLEWAGCKVTAQQRLEWKLPPFPAINSEVGSRAVLSGAQNCEEIASAWLDEAVKLMRRHYLGLLAHAEHDSAARKQLRKCELLGKKLSATLAAMRAVRDCWYIVAGPTPGRRSISEWEFFAKPLTARFHFPRYFQGDHRLVLMSATIGNPDAFGKELGLTDYVFRVVPSVWEAHTRPVHQLDVPRMGQKSGEKEYAKQAEAIARAVRAVDPSWSGLIHVNSMKEADNLAQRLARLGLQERIYVQPRIATDKAVEAWRTQRRRKPNALMVTWAMWEGYNGLDEKINIVAKVPYPYLGEPYEQARMRFSGEFFIQRAATKLEQALGRTRRGNPEDYDTPDKVNGLVAVADGSVNHVKSYLSQAVRDAIVKGGSL